MAQMNHYDWLLRCSGAHLTAVTAKLQLDDAFLPAASEPTATRASEIWKLIQLRGAKGIAELETVLKGIGVPPPGPAAPPPPAKPRAAKPRPAPVAQAKPSTPLPAEPRTNAGEPRTIKIFLASSEELRADRDAFDLYFRQQNDQLRKKGLYLEINRWENFLDAMSKTRLQDEYNNAVRNCDIFVSLFFTKTGKYTREEFDVAQKQFVKEDKPLIYTFFKNGEINTGSAREQDLKSLFAFKKKLQKLGHFYTEYDNVEQLKLKFRDQLDKLYG